MIMRKGPAITALVLLAAPCTCTRLGNDLAGTATETTNGYVAAVSGGPARNAVVRLIDAKNWMEKVAAGKPVVTDSAVTDEAGRFILHSRPSSSFNLQVDGVDGGLIVTDVQKYLGAPDDTLNFSLKAYARMAGSVADPAASSAGELLFSGTASRASIGPNGAFSVPALPAGVFQMVTGGHSCLIGTVSLNPGDSINTGVLVADPQRIPVEDFSLGWERTRLGRVIGGGYWYYFIDNDPDYSGNSTMQTVIQGSGDIHDGNALHVTVSLNSGYEYPFGGVGFNIGDEHATYDFTTLKKLTFWAKGSGQAWVTVKTRMLDTLAGNWNHFGVLLTFPPVWTKIEFPVDSLYLIAGSPAELAGMRWPAAASAAHIIEFAVLNNFTAVGDTVEFWLDDIVLEGVTLDALVR
jgi:hypothetical protein